MILFDEIHEQPAVLENLIRTGWADIREIGRSLRQQKFRYIFLVARGTSDNAGRYATYLLGSHNRLPVALATPSLFSLFHTAPDLSDAVVVGVSQSGKSPDIVSVLQEAREQACVTVAITNAPQSPLAAAATFSIDIQAGLERAVAATKSYSAQLLSFVLLSEAMRGTENLPDDVLRLPEWVAQALQVSEIAKEGAQRYRFCQHCVVVGRGFNYATAYEWSLKLKELTYMVAEPYSSADFRHGPIAVVEPGFPVLSIAPSGVLYPDLFSLAQELHQHKAAEQLIISDNPEILRLAQVGLPLPAGIPEWLSPLVSIVPAQLFAYHLTSVKGHDTDQPRGLRKVTETV
ncbi:MAG TPA: SIS domain-containing protein [Anaerolineales bacterium]|nr:SIS domain-containing protein [Anaerolineales bacterium]